MVSNFQTDHGERTHAQAEAIQADWVSALKTEAILGRAVET